MSERWRGVIAALLNPDLRSALAELSGDTGLTDARRARALERLEELGMVRRSQDGFEFDDATVRGILSESPAQKRSGPARYLDADGRIDRYPSRADDHRELLAWVAARAFEMSDVLTETEVNDRLAVFADDVALLRRYLVDAGFLERTRSGSSYARVAGAV